jgi:hypothetical protein
MLPIEVQTSFDNYIDYPENLRNTGSTAYRFVLEAYKKRFDDVEQRLCLATDEIGDHFEVPIRDLATATGEALSKKNIHSQDGLEQWLGISTTVDPTAPGKLQVLAEKKDPKSRFMQVH